MVLKVVKRTEEEFQDWVKKQQVKAASKFEALGLDPKTALSTEVGWLLTFQKYEGKDLELDVYQAAFMMTKSNMRSQLKARQIGFSFGIALESLTRCHMKRNHLAICVSYNLDDAKEKINRVKELHEELPLEFQKRMAIDSKTEVGFASNDSKKVLSKVISYPSKAPRGKTGDVYLDELAHCQNDKAIYAGATALISRSGGQLTIGSTPLGRRGIFHAIHTQEFQEYPGFARQEVPWWLCSHFCKDIPRASLEAPVMGTEERVHTFGTSALFEQYNALPIEDFQQEFELVFQDERVSFYPYDLILPCANKDPEDIGMCDTRGMLVQRAGECDALYAGYDVGRSNHPSELSVFDKSDSGKYTMKLQESFKNMSFPNQRDMLKKFIRDLGGKLKKFRIDSTGLGKNLAEDLRREFGSKVEEVTFTNAIKESLANNLKIMLQEKSIQLPRNRMIVAQIHSIKQKTTTYGNVVFDTDKNQKHHADKMWSIALAVHQKRTKKKVIGKAEVRVLRRSGVEEKRNLSLAERLFADVEIEKPKTTAELVQEGLDRMRMLKGLPMDELVRRAEAFRDAARVYRKMRDKENFRMFRSRFQQVKREITRRKRAKVA